jgi:hypothetical protein
MEALTTNICRDLSGHAAVLVEVDWFVRHDLIPFFWLPIRIRPNHGNCSTVLTRLIHE